jgi:deazaflavin-dependent oxidoreductase (nitroreductase family)
MDVNRWMYAGTRPNLVARVLNRLWAGLSARGIGPQRLVELEVRGRRSGRPVTLPVVVAELDGERYLVSMLGERAAWVGNVRAAGGRAVLRHGTAEPVVLEEVPPARRAPVLRRYLEVAPGGRAHVEVATDAPLEAFERVADRYPVFRVTSGTAPADGAGASSPPAAPGAAAAAPAGTHRRRSG